MVSDWNKAVGGERLRCFYRQHRSTDKLVSTDVLPLSLLHVVVAMRPILPRQQRCAPVDVGGNARGANFFKQRMHSLSRRTGRTEM
jgi:hypothetical protein